MTATSRPTPARTRLIAALLLAALVGSAVVSGVPAQPAGAQPAPPLFTAWPKDTKPDAVLFITGQTYGYLQPCGCSRPQLGGLERRANLVKSLKDKGWPVAGVDLGDVLPVAGAVPEQVVLKYATTMPALRDMGYVAVGLGRAEFGNGLHQLLEQYAGKKEQAPFTLGGNVGGGRGGKVTPRESAFPGVGPRAMVGAVEVVEVGGVPVGVVSVVGPSVQKAVAALGPKTLVGFTAEKDALAAASKELDAHAKKPVLNVLLYQGTVVEAKQAAKDWPQFRVVVCLSDDSEPPADADTVARPNAPSALVVRVGHKGRYVGLVGAFKTADGGIDLKYQLVPLGEEYVTPGTEEQARKANPALQLLEEYAEGVTSRNLLAKFPVGPHPAQLAQPKRNLTFVGSEACAKCHAAEHKQWGASKHAHAFDALEKVAKRPAGRHRDGECVVCHTVGFGYTGGYRDELTTPALRHVGCETCHGPGSGHAADPKDAKLLALQSPWRRDAGDRLPDPAAMTALAKYAPADRGALLKPGQLRAVSGVAQTCTACHDGDNDPRFDLFTYWPRVAHPAAKK